MSSIFFRQFWMLFFLKISSDAKYFSSLVLFVVLTHRISEDHVVISKKIYSTLT